MIVISPRSDVNLIASSSPCVKMHWVFNLLQRLKPVHPTASASKHETKPPGGGGGFENDEVDDEEDDKERVNDC